MTTSGTQLPGDERIPNDRWRLEEEAKLFELVEEGMPWTEIPNRFPGRSEKSCRLHYYRKQKRLIEDPRAQGVVRLYNR